MVSDLEAAISCASVMPWHSRGNSQLLIGNPCPISGCAGACSVVMVGCSLLPCAWSAGLRTAGHCLQAARSFPCLEGHLLETARVPPLHGARPALFSARIRGCLLGCRTKSMWALGLDGENSPSHTPAQLMEELPGPSLSDLGCFSLVCPT